MNDHEIASSTPSGSTESEQAAEAQAEILRVLEANLPLSVWAIDRRGIFTHHAGHGLTRAGLKWGQWLGQNIFELYSEDETFMGPLRKALAGESGHVCAQVHGVDWESWLVPVRDKREQVCAVIGVSLDVSEAQRAQDALKAKLELIERQNQVIRSLSTPILEVWDKVLTLPLLGVLDSGRTASVMQELLSRIAETGARFAILDLTGVDAVDTATAAHLLKLIQAIRLLGAEGIITGIQPTVAQTMVEIGLELQSITTRANLREGLRFCMKKLRADGA
jgi:rsbT co-antagonist protein RsbR